MNTDIAIYLIIGALVWIWCSGIVADVHRKAIERSNSPKVEMVATVLASVWVICLWPWFVMLVVVRMVAGAGREGSGH